MKKSKVWILVTVLAVLLFIGAYFLYNNLSENYIADSTASSDSKTSVQSQAQQAPDFTAETPDGREVKLSDYFGKPIVLNLWASWCSPCKREMPHFENAFKENKDIQFLMVNMTSGDTISDAKNLIKDNGYTFPVLFDTRSEAAYAYNASSLPITFFIDKDGNIAGYYIGMLSAEKLQAGINTIRK